MNEKKEIYFVCLNEQNTGHSRMKLIIQMNRRPDGPVNAVYSLLEREREREKERDNDKGKIAGANESERRSCSKIRNE